MSSTETKLQAIADALNTHESGDDPGYNHWTHAESLAHDVGMPIDHERQEREDECASYSICFDGGWNLDLSCDEWCVSEPEDDGHAEADEIAHELENEREGRLFAAIAGN